MRIAVVGCVHGELDAIYDAIANAEKVDRKKVDLLICCGDFQSTRNLEDLKCMAVPDQFKAMGSFYKYYSGEKIARVLTIFIGGNHEASNYLQELAYGGWVAPNIYYLGYAGVINVAGIRIGGLSGIYNSHSFRHGHHEYPPYNYSTIRSACHVRNLEIFRLKQLSGKLDIFMSHDWPQGITNYGNTEALLKYKPYLRKDIESNNLGSPPAMDVLKTLFPSRWYSAHLHCHFTAVVQNEDKSKTTTFLALNKVMPRRKFLEFIEVEHDRYLPMVISHDLEWLTVLYHTNHLLSVNNDICKMPGPSNNFDGDQSNFCPTEEQKMEIYRKFKWDLSVPLNFKKTVLAYSPRTCYNKKWTPLVLAENDQTKEFCEVLEIDDPLRLIKESIKTTNSGYNMSLKISAFKLSAAEKRRSDQLYNEESASNIDDSSPPAVKKIKSRYSLMYTK